MFYLQTFTRASCVVEQIVPCFLGYNSICQAKLYVSNITLTEQCTGMWTPSSIVIIRLSCLPTHVLSTEHESFREAKTPGIMDDYGARYPAPSSPYFKVAK
ncbi:hypothetical protein GDO81_013143 [Engystomops pustulosus]|uniref:Uncharacterized protein n=1 Tax=Engystomops pustulosus TaxID=76066 RepID=A0AAV7B2K4_ENGPU|nr:hypothetical protein GDO81_013143 [Engystomops pustulosus]